MDLALAQPMIATSADASVEKWVGCAIETSNRYGHIGPGLNRDGGLILPVTTYQFRVLNIEAYIEDSVLYNLSLQIESGSASIQVCAVITALSQNITVIKGLRPEDSETRCTLSPLHLESWSGSPISGRGPPGTARGHRARTL